MKKLLTIAAFLLLSFPILDCKWASADSIFSPSPWRTSGADTFYNRTSGNVGIGTAKPISRLDIQGGNVGIGTQAASQALTVNGSVLATGYVNSLSLVATASLSAASGFAFTGLNATTQYMMVFNLLQNTANGSLTYTFNSDGGANYQYCILSGTGAAAASAVGSGTNSIPLSPATTLAGQNINGTIHFSTATSNTVTWRSFGYSSGAAQSTYVTTGYYSGAAPLTRVDFSVSAGTITGSVRLYALQ